MRLSSDLGVTDVHAMHAIDMQLMCNCYTIVMVQLPQCSELFHVYIQLVIQLLYDHCVTVM